MRLASGSLIALLTVAVLAASGSLAQAYVLAGSVDRDPFCDPGAEITVWLSPSARSATVDASGMFRFEDVPDGDYVVTAEPECQPSEYSSDAVYVRGSDAYSRLFWSQCPRRAVVRLAEDRQTAEIEGRCYYIHSGASANVYLDDELVGTVRGDTPGVYGTTLDISGLALGEHLIQITTPSSQIGYGVFWLDAAPCAGDCNGDERVAVNELVYGVSLALDIRRGGCDRLDVDDSETIEIAELVEATGALLNGCPYAPRQ